MNFLCLCGIFYQIASWNDAKGMKIYNSILQSIYCESWWPWVTSTHFDYIGFSAYTSDKINKALVVMQRYYVKGD